MFTALLINENGAAAVEYVLILGIISMVLIAALTPLQKELLKVVSKTTLLVSKSSELVDDVSK